MSYCYQIQRSNIFCEDGQVMFLKIRDRIKQLIAVAGAARVQEIIKGIAGDGWDMLACIDLLVELGEIKEITSDVIGQHRVFVAVE